MTEGISIFRSLLYNRRFNDGTLSILESILASKDVKSLLEIRSILKELLRSQALHVLQENIFESVDLKLSVVEFFVNAFALVGDVDSCLALKYEALVLRELEYVNHQWLKVSYEEWLTFAEDSFDNGFYFNAVKGYENALQCIQPTKIVQEKRGIFSAEAQIVEKIKKWREMARALVASNSVQAQTAAYLERKCVEPDRKCDSYSMDTQHFASSMFRSGIKKRNMQGLHRSRRLI